MPLFHVRGVPIGYVSILLALVASMGGFVFGYDTGQISDILLMDDFKLRFAKCATQGVASTCHFSTVRAGVIVALLSIGTMVGAILGAPVADLLGRRRAMVVECFIFMIGVAIQLATIRVWQQFAVGRLVSGLGVGALSAAVPTYQAETAPANIRGTLTATYQLFITLGILVAYSISIGTRYLPGATSWRTVVGIGLIWPGILSIGISFMPESPRWLVTRGRLEEAETSVARAHGVSKSDVKGTKLITAEMDKIRNHWEQERATRGGWIDCFNPKHQVLYRTFLGMALQSFQQLTGANYFFYYGATVFSAVGIVDPFITQIILGAVNFFGRRLPLIYGGIWQSCWLFIFAAVGTAKNPATDRRIGTSMIVSACMFILGYAMTWGPGVWIIIGETFPTRTRAKQAALATAANWLWNFLLAFFTPFITSAIHFRYGFIFATCNLTGAIIVYFFLYESSNLSLENVDNMYNDPDCRPWNSRGWKPVGYSSRLEEKQKINIESVNGSSSVSYSM